MAEISTEENEKLVASIYDKAMAALHAGQSVTAPELLVHDVEHLMQEVNSGISYGQYFRWSSCEEIGRIRDHLRVLGLTRVLELTSKAIEIAFPKGLPADDAAKQASTDNWTPQQEEELGKLFEQLEEENGHVTNVLAEYARRTGA